MPKEAKTNAMRMLERAKVAYSAHEYPHEEGQAVDGANVARLTGQDPAKVFKTLVTQGADRNYYVFVVPVLAELDLKKAAKAAGVKSVAMIHVADRKQRKVAVGILSAAALTAFLTGVTEPLEFSFMFLAPTLYAMHAFLTGLSMVVMALPLVALYEFALIAIWFTERKRAREAGQPLTPTKAG